MRDGGVDDLARDVRAAHQLGDDVHFGMLHHLAPVGGPNDVVDACRQLLAGNRAAAQRLHAQIGKPSFSAI